MNLDTRIKFRHLLCFLEIARQGSLARAADVLAISQPAISKTLKELEDLLEARLFERGHNGVTLTPAGTRFMRYAGPSVQALRDGVGSVRGEARAPSQVRIGVLSTVEGLLMPEVLCRLHQRHEALLISVVTGASAQLLGQLHLGELELVVGRMTDSPQIQGLSFEHLYSESMTLVVRPGHPLLAQRPVERSQVGDYPLVLPPPGTTIRQHADSLFVQCAIPLPAQRLETLSLALSRRYVLGSQAVWVAPRDAVLIDLGRGELAELDLGVLEPGGSVGICRNAALPQSLPAQWVCEVLREVAEAYRLGTYP
ncbi:pca operon transcription factor PcaQ [Pseudomonas mosselii]|uniref:pca operon transcription factor PcaQ n=1 Tax=Pseudomonas mosselii TaxID=78327 RepID=UPI001644439A|nr:pca operon transcription factor PcaQ [Pseudomonas mosselii]MBC3449791.1 pca operon transcription factor PcaQ [Pseudomonas mosselii]MDN4496169.1 pca operon transcription factor PcaQ [Pseudomonas mosselii]MEA3235457.1 pca operon transcription factor PcaQ [Pseudomonas mosselii]UVN45443.1 pca operon transcription factor PcaQ [Pseudomonas mosselii]UWS66275.1 pca operon transcription factor PcaQ [Pseudomonas mosselii]